ncbi:AAA family ATPase [Variovorax sp. AB1(2024)]|uniref:AAA family ATPase n=1 Tax=Variovorax sp. AB1(2024) TaxID=3132214 RepID=UPI003096300C
MEEALQEPPVLRVKDVFVPGGFPKHTYQPRAQFKIEAKLTDALDRLPKFIAVAGPTKSGKTVLVRKVVPSSDCVWLEGGHLKSIADVWAQILAELGLPSQTVKSQGLAHEDSYVGEMDVGFRPMGVGGGVKGQKAAKDATNSSNAATFNVSAARTAVDALVARQKVLVIDDFHYLEPELQTEVIRALKPAVFEGLQVVLILIPHRMHQAASAEMDVDGRTVTIPIPEWQNSELFSIGETGFRLLNVHCLPTVLDALVKECFASPHMMQDFCSALCRDAGIRAKYLGEPPSPAVKLPVPPDSFFKEFAESISPETFKALRKGPERTNRKDRGLQGGGTCDTYQAVMLALHELGGVTPVDWTKLRKALQQLLIEVPQQHEVTRALEKMDEIAKDREGEPVIDFANGELHLVDPFFRYYVKWNGSILEDGDAAS